MDSHKFRSSLSDKNLIAEQPGLKVVVAGLAAAFLLGHIASSALSPARVAAHVEKASRQIHKDVAVKFGKAEFSLSNGILPRMAVVISQVRMESANPCWASPILEVDELVLPISLIAALRGEGAVNAIEANNVSLRLRQGFDACAEAKAATTPGESEKTLAPLVSLSPPESSRKYGNEIRTVSFRSLQISSDKYPQYQPEFLNFAVVVKSFAPRVIELSAKSHLVRDATGGDYLSHANIFVQYKESPQPSVQAHFFGNWREGHYSVIGNYVIDENMLTLESDVKHIPLSQIVWLLQRYELAPANLNARQVWISGKARTMTAVDEYRKAAVEVRDVRLEGDLGEMRVDRFDVTSIDPFTHKPLDVDIRRLDVQRLMALLNGPQKIAAFGSLGYFTGRAHIVSDKKISLTGEHSGLEFVFANKGQSEIQVIESLVGDAHLNGDTWNFNISRVEPRGGLFVGSVKAQTGLNFKDVDIKARIEELSFAPAVQNLMTNGGNIGVLTMDTDLKLKEGRLNFIKGLLRVESMNIEGMTFDKTKATFDWHNGEMVLQAQLKKLSVEDNSAAAPLLRQVTLPDWWGEGGLSLIGLSGESRSRSFDVFSWKNFKAQVGKNGKFSTEGSWNATGELRGQVQAQENRHHSRWTISGTRALPTFHLENPKAGGTR